jgi:hypothetical protein
MTGDNSGMEPRDFPTLWRLLATALETRAGLRRLPPSPDLDYHLEQLDRVIAETSDELRFRSDLAEGVAERLRARCR